MVLSAWISNHDVLSRASSEFLRLSSRLRWYVGRKDFDRGSELVLAPDLAVSNGFP